MNNFKKLLITSAICLGSTSILASAQPIDSVNTIVNNGVILTSDISNLVAKVSQNAQPGTLPPNDVLTQQVLEQLILEELQLQEAARMGIQIDNTRVDQTIARIAQDKKLTIDQVRQELARDGISWSEYREQIRKELLITEARSAQVRNRINVLPQEVNALVKQLKEQNQDKAQYKISHIQLNVNENATQTQREAVKEEAQALVDQLNHGANFAALALANSNGEKALEGGNWGWLNTAEMPTIFADQVAGKSKGAIIGPFQSGVGYHIIKVDDVKGQEMVAVEEINARHILIKPSIILSDEGAENQLKTITRQIQSGKYTFEELAKKYSADPGSAAKGGELGWQTSDIYVPEFKDTIDHLPTGEISAPFKTVHGWHIAEVIGKRQANRTEEALQNRAYRILFNRKFSEEVQTWLQELRAGAYVENINGNRS